MKYYDTIRGKLEQSLNCETLVIEDQSHLHAGHSGASPEGETHFRLRIVSDDFCDKTRVERHQMIYRILKDELEAHVHALTLNTQTKQEASDKE